MSRELSPLPAILALRYLLWPSVLGALFLVSKGLESGERALRFLQIETASKQEMEPLTLS